MLRRILALIAAATLCASLGPTASGSTSYVARIGGYGAARYTPGVSLYLNLRKLTPGSWRQELWAGNCQTIGKRLASLSPIAVTSSGVVAKTTRTTVAMTLRMVVLLSREGSVVCGDFFGPWVGRYGPRLMPLSTPALGAGPFRDDLVALTVADLGPSGAVLRAHFNYEGTPSPPVEVSAVPDSAIPSGGPGTLCRNWAPRVLTVAKAGSVVLPIDTSSSGDPSCPPASTRQRYQYLWVCISQRPSAPPFVCRAFAYNKVWYASV
jgi:hypothetical protein